MKTEKLIIRKMILFNGWQIGELESWFTDMAAGGFHLKKCGVLFAEFERGEPGAYRYRLEITPKSKAMPDEQKALYAESGWEYVSRIGVGMIHVFRSPENAETTELHTDPAEQSYTMKYLNRRMRLASVFAGIAIVLNIFLLYLVVLSSRTPILDLVEGRMSNIPLLFLLMLYSNGTIIWGAITLNRLIRSMREGRALHHNVDWRRSRQIGKVIMWVTTVLGVIVIAFPIPGIVGMLSRETIPLTKDYNYILRLDEIENDPTLEKYTGPENLPDYLKETYNQVESRWSPFASVILETQEHGRIPGRLWIDGSSEYTPSLYCKLYHVATPWLAEGLLRDFRKWYENTTQTALVKMEQQGYDLLFVSSDSGGYYSVLLAKRGTVVIQVRYSGEKDLESVIQVLSEFLDNE